MKIKKNNGRLNLRIEDELLEKLKINIEKFNQLNKTKISMGGFVKSIVRKWLEHNETK